jgi:hypothetical protein
LCRVEQLAELHLGSSTKKADGNSNTFSEKGFTTMMKSLNTMPKLTTLDMQLPHVQKLNISGMGTH